MVTRTTRVSSCIDRPVTRIGGSTRQVYKGIHQKARASFTSSSTHELISKDLRNLSTMKCIVLVALFALFAVAFAQAPKPVQPEQEQSVEGEASRDKRGLLLASYTAPAALAPAPIAYSSYVAPAAPISYALPYAYRAYPSYTYLG
ncbi:uncharacterized protein LOC102671994 [Apis dorsata]|uniref:uncharacterized protein LOC102671994 n=1 Tax=Apis dorsata TaxID=7462 RepID=UPI0003DF7F2B|nr:uncharacterized protein LOC102671994 [Apis dorsata]